MYWYEDEVKRLEHIRKTLPQKPTDVFYGSSSIRMWETLKEDFPEANTLNFGFGGSTLAACAWYFSRVMKEIEATSFVIYAGDNDLGDGRHPEEVFNSFKLLVIQVREMYGNIPIAFISIKPSIRRWDINDSINYTNKIVKEEIGRRNDENLHFVDIHDKMILNGYPDQSYFLDDNLHLSQKGYELWKTALKEYSSRLF